MTTTLHQNSPILLKQSATKKLQRAPSLIPGQAAHIHPTSIRHPPGPGTPVRSSCRWRRPSVVCHPVLQGTQPAEEALPGAEISQNGSIQPRPHVANHTPQSPVPDLSSRVQSVDGNITASPPCDSPNRRFSVQLHADNARGIMGHLVPNPRGGPSQALTSTNCDETSPGWSKGNTKTTRALGEAAQSQKPPKNQ